MQAMRRGWYLGKETFKDRLLKLLDKPAARAPSGRSRTGTEFRDHGEKDAARLIRQGSKALGLSTGKVALTALPKSDERKIVLACLLREKTRVSNHWIASRLSMGHPGSVSRTISAGKSDKNLALRIRELAEILVAGEESTS